MRIQKCSSTWRRAKSRQNAHPEMLDHILVQVERFVPLPANAKFQDTLTPKLSKNVKNAKFQDATRPKLGKNVKNAKFQDTLTPKLGKNAKNAKFQDAMSPKLGKNAKNAKFQDVARTWGQSQVIGVETCANRTA